jgi:CheY-like chemotaxis protein
VTDVSDTSQVILLVEDNTNDALLSERALIESGAVQRIVHVPDGEDAIKYLKGDPPYSDRNNYPLPVLMLLDLKMPRLTGFDVLTWLQENPGLAAKIPVVVLTGSIHPADMRRAKELGAIGFEIKPVEFSQLIKIAKKVSQASNRPLETN